VDPLVRGNVDLALQALELGRSRAADAGDVAQQQREYEAAAARQAAALAAAGYGPASPVDGGAPGASASP
jgi:hypothetical protein